MWGVITRRIDWFKLIGSAVTSGPWERLGVLTTQGGKPSQADTVIGVELSASWVVCEQRRLLPDPVLLWRLSAAVMLKREPGKAAEGAGGHGGWGSHMS